ncbi:hypothetical protein AAHC03_01714 [Spirometra sp. Aus1]
MSPYLGLCVASFRSRCWLDLVLLHRSRAMASGDEKLIQEIDDLDTDQKYKECYDKINPPSGDYQQLSCELLWRFARTCLLTEGVSDKKLKASLIKEGLAATKYAVEKYPKNANCNTWYGIFLDLEGQQEGIKKRIENAYKVKEYFQALGYFLKAENVKPMALANNVCRIAQCYAKTGQGDKAKEYAAKVLEFTGMDEETKEAKKEAQYILAH